MTGGLSDTSTHIYLCLAVKCEGKCRNLYQEMKKGMGTSLEPSINDSVAILMPALNELPNLQTLVPRIHEELQSATSGLTAVYVIVEISPSEHLQEALEQLDVQVIARKPTDSFGDAIRTGIAAVHANFEYIIVMDADGSHRPETIPRLLEAAGHCDVVIASRYTRGGSTANGLVLTLMSRALNLGYRLVLGLKCSDISTNFKLYRRTDLQAITLQCQAFDIVEEIIFRLHKLHNNQLVIIEIPDHFAQRNYGKTKRRLGPFIVAYFVTLIRLRFSRMP